MDELVRLILDAFGLTADALSALVDAIKNALLDAMAAAYQRCLSALGLTSASDAAAWTPTQENITTATQLAQSHAESIVQTYQRELVNVVQGYAQSYESANGSLDGIEGPMGDLLTQWTATRSAYKSEQITGYECGLGAEQGFQAFVADLASGSLIDPETGEVLSGDSGDYAIAVLPAESSHDECRDYAGQTFDVQEADSLPEFPLHAGCPHYKTLVMM